jgi:hypothetical protein
MQHLARRQAGPYDRGAWTVSTQSERAGLRRALGAGVADRVQHLPDLGRRRIRRNEQLDATVESGGLTQLFRESFAREEHKMP